MQIFLRNLEGETKAVEAVSVADLSTQVAAEYGVEVRLSGLDSTSQLQENQVIDINIDLLGAGKKRKKKTYTKPKKKKHVHKKSKLHVLKYYKVDANNKVKRLRSECPNCGPGIFMAMHTAAGRYYCGKCTLTYVLPGDQA